MPDINDLRKLPKPLLFGAFGAVGCLALALGLGEILLALLMPAIAQEPPPPPPPPPQVDVLFVLDRTTSMTGELHGVQQGILEFAEQLSARKLDARVGLLAFGDRLKGSTEPIIPKFGDSPFTSDVRAFQAEVDRVRLVNGVDDPESSLDALGEASKQPFRAAATKVILFITDAPPHIPDRTIASPREVAEMLKKAGIDQLHLVCNASERRTFEVIQAPCPGEFFDIQDAARGSSNFAQALPEIGKAIAQITIERLPKVSTLVTSTAVNQKDTGQLVFALGVWSGVLAIGITLALIAGQNFYLNRPWLTREEAIKGGLGATAAGVTAGWLGQYASSRYGGESMMIQAASRIVGWGLLGGLVGLGVAMIVKNLPPKKALAGGAIGGVAGAVGFYLATPLGDFMGRMLGAGLLGFFIGMMVALAEIAFRKYWLQITFSPGEVRSVNLGDAPVSIGSNSKTCAIWLPRAEPVQLTYLLRDGCLTCADAHGNIDEIEPGDLRHVGQVEVLVQAATAVDASATPSRVEWTPPAPPPPPQYTPPPVPQYTPPPVPQHTPNPDFRQKPATAPVAPPPAANPNACPKCGHVSPGTPGRRVCMVCDNTF